MTALNRKLLREVWQHRGQMLSIAAVVAIGVMTVLTMRGTYESLVAVARSLTIATARFPDVWVQLERAPESLGAAPARRARRRRRRHARDPVGARSTCRASMRRRSDCFVSIPERRRSMLGDLHITSGRYIAPGGRDEVLVSEKFAAANALGPGDSMRAVINGRRRVARDRRHRDRPRALYAVPPGSLFPGRRALRHRLDEP